MRKGPTIKTWIKHIQRVAQTLPMHVNINRWGNECGTPSCLWGHCCSDPWFKKQGLSLHQNEWKYNGMIDTDWPHVLGTEQIREITGFTQSQCDSLFSGGAWKSPDVPRHKIWANVRRIAASINRRL